MGMGLAVVLSSIWGRKSKTIPQMFPSCSQIVTEQLGDNAGNVVSASTAEVKKRSTTLETPCRRLTNCNCLQVASFARFDSSSEELCKFAPNRHTSPRDGWYNIMAIGNCRCKMNARSTVTQGIARFQLFRVIKINRVDSRYNGRRLIGEAIHPFLMNRLSVRKNLRASGCTSRLRSPPSMSARGGEQWMFVP